MATARQAIPLNTTTNGRLIILIILGEITSVAMQEQKEIEKIPIEEAMELLRKEGIDVEREEAELIMEFLYNLTMVVIRECFDVE